MSDSLGARRSCRLRWRGESGERGQILVLTAVSVTVLLGVAALSVDASYMYDKYNRLHAAADAAAKSAAIEILRNNSVTEAQLQLFGEQQVAEHLFNPPTPTIVDINWPPSLGPFAGDDAFVEAIVSEDTDTFFGAVLGIFSMNPTARAVASTAASNDCLVAIDPEGLSSVGAASVTPECDAALAGNLNLFNPNAQINGSLTGECTGSGDCSQVSEGPPPGDPLAGQFSPPSDPGCQLLPAPPTPCPVTVPNNSAMTIPAGLYTSIDVGTNATLTLSPGIYYITGSFSNGNNTTITGSGVMIYLTGGGQINLSGNNATLSLSAIVGGDYNGILFYQDPSNSNPADFNGNSLGANFSGVFYMPSAHVTFRNGLSGTTDCAIMVVQSFEIRNGNGILDNTCSGFGGSPLVTVALAE